MKISMLYKMLQIALKVSPKSILFRGVSIGDLLIELVLEDSPFSMLGLQTCYCPTKDMDYLC
jgi:hypothetical protein